MTTNRTETRQITAIAAAALFFVVATVGNVATAVEPGAQQTVRESSIIKPPRILGDDVRGSLSA